MRENIKTLLAFGVIVGIGVILYALSEAKDATGIERALILGGGFIVGLLPLALLLKMHLGRNKYPHFLAQLTRQYFGRDGFCFAVTSHQEQGIGYLRVIFQNQFERTCRAEIGFQPARQFLSGLRRKFECVRVEVECPGSGFGEVLIPLPVPKQHQGEKQKFEVGATVKYPRGRGKQIRRGDGLLVGAPPRSIRDSITSGLGRKRAWVSLDLPYGVAEELPDDTPIVCKILWTPEDDGGINNMHMNL